MNRKIPALRSVYIAAVALGFQACSSSSGTTDGAIDATSSSTVNSTLNAIEGLLFDTEEANSSSAKIRRIEAASKKSFAGCHYDLDRKRMLQNFDRIRGPICAISTLDEVSDNFNVSEDGSYSYFFISMPSEKVGEDDSKSFRMRVRIKDDCLQFDRCEQGSSGFEQRESFSACNDGKGGIKVASQDRHIGKNPTTQEETKHKNAMSIEVKGTVQDDETIELDSFEMSNKFEDDHGEGLAVLTGDKSAKKNTMRGNFEGTFSGPEGATFSHSNKICVIAGGGTGSVQMEGTNEFSPWSPNNIDYYCPPPPGSESGTMPTLVTADAKCEQEFDFSESFMFEFTDGKASASLVEPASDGEWYASLETDCVGEVPTMSTDFESTWDCKDGNGGEDFVEIDLADFKSDLEPCFSNEDRVKDDQESCEEQRNQEVEGELPK